MKFIFSLFIFFTFKANAFLVIDPNYHLANHKDVIVNIGQGGCQANGISNDELMVSINESIDNYWNKVTESELRLRSGGEVDRTTAVPGEIIVYCSPLGVSGSSGVTYPDISAGSARIVLNGSTFVPGGYLPGAVTGVLAHEMGHAIGLNHSGDPASVMTYESHTWRIVPSYLSQDDKDGVAFLYPRDGQLGGLIPGCSAIAKDQRSYSVFTFWNYLTEIIFIFSVLVGLKYLRRLWAKNH